MKLVALHRQYPGTWCLVPIVLDRVRAMSAEYGDPGDVELLCQSIEAGFMAANPLVVALAVVDETEVIGHLVMSFDMWLGHSYVTVVQYSLDRPVSRGFADEQRQAIEKWAASRGAKEIRAIVGGPHAAGLERAYRVFHGFRRLKVVVGKSLATGSEEK